MQLKTQLEPELLAVDGDPDALSHALMNLCVNSVDAMREGGTLTITTANVAPQRIELAVHDTGCGMEPAVLERALEPFFSTKPPGEGTGLGLSRVYGTVRAHGGVLDLHSSPGTGTRVVVRLPGRKRRPRGETRGDAGQGATARGVKVLVIDDDDLVRISLTRMLGQLGASVTADPGGKSALDRLEAGLEVGLVILDMNMPGMSGADTLRSLRSLRPELPVILSTGLMDQRAIEAGSNVRGRHPAREALPHRRPRGSARSRARSPELRRPGAGAGHAALRRCYRGCPHGIAASRGTPWPLPGRPC